MSPRRRMAVFAGVGLAVIALGFLVVALGGDSPDKVVAQGSSTSSSSTSSSVPETTTTVDLVPETTTTAVPRPPSTTTTTAPPPAPVVNGSGAVLQAPSSAASKKMEAEDCSSLADSGWTAVCGFATVKGGGTLVWLVESQVATGARRVRVFGPGSGPGSWRAVLEARDDNGSRWAAGDSGVVARVVDLSGDTADEIVVGYRAASGGALAMDVVEGPGPSVTAHRDLASGRSRVSPGQWDTWAALSSGPSSQYQHDTIRWQDNAWRVVLRSTVAASDVPPSQF